ncbi:hypothetical protein DV737_g4295, partial [Chaetothyriales sp. CBS 132003]
MHKAVARMTVYTIEITSDIVCPWCYIGHARLSRAIAKHKEAFPGDTFKLQYKPFYLDPAAQVYESLGAGAEPAPFPVPSKPRRQVYAQKFGPQRAKQLEEAMRQTAAREGLSFKYGGMTGPSRNGHRLVHYAQTHGGEEGQNAVMLALWRRYFEQEVDITTLDTLVAAGVEAGLGTADDVRRYLESGQDAKLVDEEAAEAVEKDIGGVPHYLIQGQWEVSGAQDPRAFEQLFQRWKATERPGAATDSAGKAIDSTGQGCPV